VAQATRLRPVVRTTRPQEQTYAFSALIASTAFVESFVATFVAPCSRDKGFDEGRDKVCGGGCNASAVVKQIPAGSAAGL